MSEEQVMNQKEIGKRLTEIMRLHDISEKELAMHLGRDETTVNSMYITKAETGLNFRTGATTNSSVISTIPYNTKLYVTTVYKSGGYSWGYTRYNGIEGYCAIEYAEKI